SVSSALCLGAVDFPFFSFTMRLPPSSTLFPYTTLFRSQLGKTFVVGSAEQALHRVRALPELHPHGRALRYPPLPWHRSEERAVRSEEHTSELQSRENLVCRLLLEKKKKKKRTRQETPRA